MLKVEYPINYLKKEGVNSEILEEIQYVKQLNSQQKTLRFKRSGDNLELPENFKVGQAVGGGDCFFDSVAQGLKRLKPEMDFTVKSLREVCKKFAQSQLENDQSWLKEILKNENEQINEYIPRIEFTANDIEQKSESVNVLGLISPIWGRSEIEGRIICKEYNVKLHIVEKHVVEGKEVWLDQIVNSEGSRSVDSIDYDEENTIHIINRGNAHFEPILNAQEVQYNRQQSSNHDTPEKELKIPAEEQPKKQERSGKKSPNLGDSDKKSQGSEQQSPVLSADRVKRVDNDPNQAGPSQQSSNNRQSDGGIDSDDEREKNTELFSAIRNGDLQKIQELLKAEVKVDIIDKNNKDNTPLHYAIERGKEEIAEKLLQEWKADIDAKNNKGDTPLHIATSKGNKKLVQLLLSEKAEVNIKNNQGYIPLDIAKSLEKQDIVQVLELHIQQVSVGEHPIKQEKPSEENKLEDTDRKNQRSEQERRIPYSDKLPFDKELKLSNGNFKSIIESDIKHVELNTVDKLNFLNRPAYPDKYLLVRFASRVYKEREDGQELPDKKLPEGWKLLTTAYNQGATNHYFGVAYWNPDQQQIVIAHRGTDPSSTGALWTDIRGILQNNYVPQMNSAVTFANEIKTVLNELNKKPNVNLQLSFTGHSLGGWLAQITTFTTKYFTLEPFEESSFFVKSEKVGYHAHTVTFDSPGSKDMLSKIKSDFDLRHYKDDNSLSLSYLDITSYLSAPNLVNTCCLHLGTIYRVFIEDLPSERSSWDFAKYTKETHSIVKIEEALDPEKGNELKTVIDWPLVKKGITKRALEKLLSSSHGILGVLRKVVFNQGESEQLPERNEYEYFHKLAKDVSDYNPGPDDKEGYCTVRYQVQNVDKTQCGTRIFTHPELEFLRDYQKLRQFLTLPQLQGLFSSFNNENMVEEAIKVLKTFKVEDKKKTVHCQSETELNKLIAYVKNALYFFPDVKGKTKNAQTRKPIWFDVKDLVRPFTALTPGRREKLEQIASSIQEGIVVISGLGGVGKSELAVKYARSQYNQEDSVVWINAETHETAKDSFHRLHKKLGLKIRDEDGEEKSIELVVEDIYKHLNDGKRLFIFDGAEKYSTIEKFLPLGLPDNANKPYVLITSPNNLEWKSIRVNIETLSLGDFTDTEAIEFVKTALKIGDDSQNVDIINLVKRLHNFPLALQHAVTYIKDASEEFQARGSEFKISDYLEKYEQEPKKMLSIKSIDDEHTEAIFRVLKITIDKIKDNKEYGQQALDMLNIVSYFMSRNIPEETFLNKLASGNQEKLISITRLLRKYSIVNLEQGMLNVHGLVQQIRRLELGDQQEEEKTLERALGLLKEYVKASPGNAASCIPHIISIWDYASKYDELIKSFIVDNTNNKATTSTTYFDLIIEGSNYEVIDAIIKKISSDNLKEVINAKNKDDVTPLHKAVLRDDEKIVKFLIDKGADVNAKKSNGWTPLHLAAKNGNLEVVNALLAKGANVDDKTSSKYQFIPLHLSARNGHKEVVEALLAKNADINAKTEYEFTPLHLAANNGHLDVVQALLEDKKIIIDAETKDKSIPLHLAAKMGHLSVVKALLEKNADVNAQNKDGFTPLHLAALNGHVEIVNKLLENYKIGIDARTNKGNTPLHLAAEKGHLEIVKAFIAKNADINIKNEDGNTASDLAHSGVKDYISSIYKRTKGAAGIEGQLCEINLSMLLLLKGITDERISGFHLASNMEKADKFDDIVFKYEYKEGIIKKSKIIFLQAKHKTDQKGVNINSLFSDSESGGFSLKKYFISYSKIKQQFSETKGPVFSSNFEDSEFIIYTNAPFASTDSSIKEGNIDQNDFLRISDLQSKYYQLEFNSNKKERIVNLLKDSSDSRRLAKELVQSISSGQGIDMQKDIFQSYHTALQGKVIEKIDDKLEGELSDNFLNDDASLSSEDKEFRRVFLEEAGKVFKKQGNELKQELQNKVIKLSNKFGINSGSENLELPNDDPVAEDEIRDFLNKFKLFASQPSEKDLEKVIKDKVKEVYRVEQQDIDSVFSDVGYKVKEWWQSGNNYLKKDNKFFEDAARVSIKFDVKEPVTLFTGRIRELENLHKILQDGGEAVISQMASVTGLGGIGKSELARKYISEHNKDYDNNVIWINADNYLTIAESFRRLAQDKLRISTKDENGKEKEIKLIVEDVYRFFAKRHRRSLFVFDNAGKHKAVREGEEAEGVDKFLPSDPNKPHILITSRDQEWGEIKSLPLGVFTEEEAIEFIKKALKSVVALEDNEVKRLAEELQYLPLALKQAVAYIKVENQGLNKWEEGKFTIGSYLEQFKEKANELLSRESSETHDRYTETVMTTWQITIDKIKQKKVRGGEQALEILDIIAYLAPDKIPVDEIFSKLINDEEVRHNAVELLDQYSMANLESGKLNIHRLVQQVTRINLKKQNKEVSVLREALTLLKKFMEEEQESCTGNVYTSHAISVWSYIDQYKELVEEFSNLPSNIINRLTYSAKYEEAYAFGVKATELLSNILGLNHQSVLTIRNNVALVLHKQGKYNEALKIYNEICQAGEVNLVVLNNIAGVLDDQGKYDEALKIYNKICQAGEVNLIVLNNIAGVLDDQGKYDEALKIYNDVYKKWESKLGTDHLNTLTTRNNIARILYRRGKYDEALKIYNDIYKKWESKLGANHLNTLIIQSNMAVVLSTQSKYDEAWEICSEIYKKRVDILGPDHPDTLTTLNDIAKIFFALSKYSEALEIFYEVYEGRKAKLAFNHPDTLIALDNIAEVLYKQGKYDEALEILYETFNTRENILSLEHPSTSTNLSNIAVIFHQLGMYNEALEIHNKVYNRIEDIFGPDSPRTLTSMYNIAAIFVQQGKYNQALQIYNNLFNRKDVSDHEILKVMEKIEKIFDKHNAALAAFQKVVNKSEQILGADHQAILTARIKIAMALYQQGKYDEALQIYNDLYNKSNDNFGPSHDNTLSIRNNMALVMFDQGKYDDALKIFKEVYDNFKKKLGPNDPNTLQVSCNMDAVLHAKNDELTSLHLAVTEGRLDATKYLIDANNAGVNAKNKYGLTPLHLAVNGNDQKIVELLLDKKADPNILDEKGKTPLALAQEKLAQDPENDNLKTIRDLLLSSKGKSQHQEEQGSVSLEECLPSTNSGRSKREAKIGECELSWEDVDEFNAEKDEKRDFSKIEIDSEKFVSYIKDLPERKRSQLIQLADEAQVTGNAQGLVSKLINNQKVMNHLSKMGKISGMTMHGMMAKNVLADFLNGDYQGVAINVGFIAGGQGFAKVAEAASLKGLKLASEGKLLLGRSLRAASPFLARGTSAFVVYDLVNQIKAFKNGTGEALVGVVGDSIYLGVDAAEIGIEIAEAFEVLEGVSSVTGPIGATIGAVVFVGTDVYMAVKRVDKIDEIIHLTGKEKFAEGLRAFIGMQPEEHIQELMQERQVSNQLVRQGLEYLKQHSNIQSYVFPTGKSIVDSCRKVPYKTSNCASGGFGGGCLRASTVTRYAEECTTKFEVDLDNTVLLDEKRNNIKWSRAKPDNPSGGQLFCLPRGNHERVPSYGSYLCENAIGITDLSAKTGNHTLINLGKGTDHAKGFIDSPNIFVVNNGSKRYFGGNKDDIFILQGSSIKGYFYGEGGINTLDLTSFAPEEGSIDVKLHIGQVEDYYRNNFFGMSGINKFLGRKAKADQVFITCDSDNSDIKFVDGQSGSEEFVDHINIHDKDCAYEMQVVVRSNTIINNRALKGDFHYIVPYALGSAKVDFIYTAEALNLNNTFVFEYEPAQIKNVDVRNINALNKTSHIITFNFSPMSDKEFNITISGASNPSYRLGNNTEIKVGNKGNLYMLENANKSVNEIIRDYLVVANRLNKMSFFIQSLLSNETVAIGSGNYEVIHNNPLQKSHLVGNGGENVYVIDSKRFEIPLPEVVIYDLDVESSVDTIDLRNLVQQARGEFSNSFKLQVLKSANDLLLKATVEKPTEDSSISKVRGDGYFTVRLKDGVSWYNKTHVIMDNVPMRISLDNNEWSLKPQPLMFEKDKEVIVVTSQDIEENTELITPKRAGNYTFVRDHGSDLIITNAFNTQDDLCTIVLSKFYETPKMETLSIKFADKEIVLKDKQKEINAARDVDIVKREYKKQVYSDVFNHSPEIMLSDQPHRHEHSRQHIRNRRMVSSSAKPSSWINDLFDWVKSSIGELLSSNTTSSISQVDGRIDVDGAIMLLDLLVRKVTGQKYISTVDQPISLLEAQGYALNIIEKFEKVLNETATKSGISVTNLNFDPVAVQSAIVGQIISEKFSEISKTLYSFAKEACPEFKQTDKFLAHLRSSLEGEKEAVLLQQKVEKPSKILDQQVSRKVELSKKPNTFLNGTSVVKGISSVLER